jgi:hypothetical protein
MKCQNFKTDLEKIKLFVRMPMNSKSEVPESLDTINVHPNPHETHAGMLRPTTYQFKYKAFRAPYYTPLILK